VGIERVPGYIETLVARRNEIVERLKSCPEELRPLLETGLEMVDRTLAVLLHFVGGPVQ
jgi:hypothetical protein